MPKFMPMQQVMRILIEVTLSRIIEAYHSASTHAISIDKIIPGFFTWSNSS